MTISAAHDAVKANLEIAREAKALGSSLQCSVIISADGHITETLSRYLDELAAIFVVSSVEMNQPVPEQNAWIYTKEFDVDGRKGLVHVLPPKQSKCPRCWRYLAEEEDKLCKRCEGICSAEVDGHL